MSPNPLSGTSAGWTAMLGEGMPPIASKLFIAPSEVLCTNIKFGVSSAALVALLAFAIPPATVARAAGAFNKPAMPAPATGMP